MGSKYENLTTRQSFVALSNNFTTDSVVTGNIIDLQSVYRTAMFNTGTPNLGNSTTQRTEKVKGLEFYIKVLNYVPLTTALVVTGNTTIASNIITNIPSTANLYVSAPISGAGITGGSKISGIVNATTITISLPATATATGVSLTTENVSPNPVVSFALEGVGVNNLPPSPFNTSALSMSAAQASALLTPITNPFTTPTYVLPESKIRVYNYVANGNPQPLSGGFINLPEGQRFSTLAGAVSRPDSSVTVNPEYDFKFAYIPGFGAVGQLESFLRFSVQVTGTASAASINLAVIAVSTIEAMM